MILQIKDLQAFYGVSATTAGKLKRTILDSLGKDKQKRLTLLDLCKYEGIELEYAKKLVKSAKKTELV